MELSNSEYKAIVESSPNMIWRSGIDAKCYYFNETWLRFTGKKMDEEVGDGWVDGVHSDDLDFCIKTYLDSFSKREPFEMEYRLKRFDGQMRWINDRGIPMFDENNNFVGYIGSCMDVTEKIEGKKMTEMAHNDKLTDVYNRNYLEYLLDFEFHKGRQEQTNLILMMMDIDKFKLFNDNYGHTFGDNVLKQVARKISENFRVTDIVGRYGGDEFVAALQNTTIDGAKMIAQRILDSVNHISIDEGLVTISLSIGLAKQSDENDIKQLIEKADKAMYQAKKDGGNRYFVSLD